ncbi:MAG: hypothetical protein K2O53_08360, partial [Bacteroidales bacterium]|nr:hypothetical protein [Bacteroidales bacterium]
VYTTDRLRFEVVRDAAHRLAFAAPAAPRYLKPFLLSKRKGFTKRNDHCVELQSSCKVSAEAKFTWTMPNRRRTSHERSEGKAAPLR